MGAEAIQALLKAQDINEEIARCGRNSGDELRDDQEAVEAFKLMEGLSTRATTPSGS
jgi:hypothetical protein